MDWILIDNKPLQKIDDSHTKLEERLSSIEKKLDKLEKSNRNLEGFLINNQKLYLKHFNIICDILQDNRGLYMRQFQNESDEIESLKPILNDIKNKPDTTEKDSQDMMLRFSNMIWRSSFKNNLTTTPTPNMIPPMILPDTPREN